MRTDRWAPAVERGLQGGLPGTLLASLNRHRPCLLISPQARGRKRSGRSAPSKQAGTKKARGGTAASGLRGALFSMQVGALDGLC